MKFKRWSVYLTLTTPGGDVFVVSAWRFWTFFSAARFWRAAQGPLPYRSWNSYSIMRSPRRLSRRARKRNT